MGTQTRINGYVCSLWRASPPFMGLGEPPWERRKRGVYRRQNTVGVSWRFIDGTDGTMGTIKSGLTVFLGDDWLPDQKRAARLRAVWMAVLNYLLENGSTEKSVLVDAVMATPGIDVKIRTVRNMIIEMTVMGFVFRTGKGTHFKPEYDITVCGEAVFEGGLGSDWIFES